MRGARKVPVYLPGPTKNTLGDFGYFNCTTVLRIVSIGYNPRFRVPIALEGI